MKYILRSLQVICVLILIMAPKSTNGQEYCMQAQWQGSEPGEYCGSRDECEEDVAGCEANASCTLLRGCVPKEGNEPVYLENPLSETNTIWEFFDKLMDAIVKIAAPVIVFFLILAGFKFVTAGGNKEKISGAKKTFGYVVFGAVIILAARIITAILVATVGTITG